MPADPATTWPLTEPQEGLWYAQALDPANPVFNPGQLVELRGPLDLDAFARAHAGRSRTTSFTRSQAKVNWHALRRERF